MAKNTSKNHEIILVNVRKFSPIDKNFPYMQF